MNTNIRRESAKIYAFPRRVPNAAEAARRNDHPTADLRFLGLESVEYGSGWYHEAAMQDERRPPKR